MPTPRRRQTPGITGNRHDARPAGERDRDAGQVPLPSDTPPPRQSSRHDEEKAAGLHGDQAERTLDDQRGGGGRLGNEGRTAQGGENRHGEGQASGVQRRERKGGKVPVERDEPDAS